MSRNQLTVAQMRTILTEDQIKAAEMVTENEFAHKEARLTKDEIAAQLGVITKTLYNWRQDPTFQQYSDHLANQVRDQFYPRVVAQLMKSIEGGHNGEPSIRAIELYLKSTNRLVDTQYTITEDRTAAPLSRKDVSDGLRELDDIINDK